MTVSQRLRSPFRYSYFNASLVLIGINVLVYALGSMFRELPLYLGMMPLAMVRLGWIWQPFTYMFVHGSLQHLLFNMLGLFFFGSYVERELGSKEFLLYYLLVGTLAGIFSFGAYALTGAWGVRLVGASGAVYAVLLAFAVINPRARIYIWGLVPVPAAVLVGAYTVMELWSEIFSYGGNIAHLTHLAGFGFGALYFPVRLKVNPIRRLITGH